MPSYKKTRLDTLLVDCGLAATRARAADLIRRGAVRVGGLQAAKPGQLVARDAVLTVSPGTAAYVSRGGLKLEAALDAFGLDVQGRMALDIGASTGGFTDVLLGRGAAKVYAVAAGEFIAARRQAGATAEAGFTELVAAYISIDSSELAEHIWQQTTRQPHPTRHRVS